MSPAGFLLLAVGISVVGSLVLWLQHRRPTGLDATIDGFRRELSALSPENSPDALVREQSRLRAERPPPGDRFDDEGGDRWALPEEDVALDDPAWWGDPDAEAGVADDGDGYLAGLYRHEEHEEGDG